MPSPDDKGEFSHISDLIEYHLATENKKQKEWEPDKNAAVDAMLQDQRQRLESEIQKKEKALAEAMNRKREQDMNDAAQKKIEEIVASQVKKDEYAKPAARGSIVNKPTSYQIPVGTTILIYTGGPPATPQSQLRGNDFEAIVSSKDVAYDPDDVLVNPILGTFKSNSGLDGLMKSLYNRDGMYFAFQLPKNDKNIPYILVPKDDVVVIWTENHALKDALEKMLNYNST